VTRRRNFADQLAGIAEELRKVTRRLERHVLAQRDEPDQADLYAAGRDCLLRLAALPARLEGAVLQHLRAVIERGPKP
jgi:hypothetical protein